MPRRTRSTGAARRAWPWRRPCAGTAGGLTGPCVGRSDGPDPPHSMVTQLSKHPLTYKIDPRTVDGARDVRPGLARIGTRNGHAHPSPSRTRASMASGRAQRCNKSMDRLEQLPDLLRPMFEAEQRRRAAAQQAASEAAVVPVSAAPVLPPSQPPPDPEAPFTFTSVPSTPLLPYVPAAPLAGLANGADLAASAGSSRGDAGAVAAVPMVRYPQLGPPPSVPEYAAACVTVARGRSHGA